MAWNEKNSTQLDYDHYPSQYAHHTNSFPEPIEAEGQGYTWSQNIEEVSITVPIAQEISSKQLDIVLKQNSIKVAVKGQPAILDGPLYSSIKTAESTWTIETESGSKSVFIVLQKGEKHSSWQSIVKGKDVIDPIMKEQMDKRMMLEKFQSETPGFDFSGAEFSGNLPADPANFMKNVK